MKRSSCSLKLRYERYQWQIYKYLSYDMYTELTHMSIPYGEITYVYIKAYVMVM